MDRTRTKKLKRIGFVSAAVILVYGFEFFLHSLYLLGVFSKKWLAFVRSGATPEEAAREGRLALERSQRREEAPFIHRVSAASPTCAITAPSVGATVSGTATSVTATAAGSGAETVQFYLDVNPTAANADIANGILPTADRLGSLDTSSPFGITWDTTMASNGAHTLACVTTNQYGGTDRTLSSLVSVTVDNADTTPPAGPVNLSVQ